MSAGRIAWSLLQQGGRQAITLVVFVLLSVRLTPAEFGLVAFAQLPIALVTIFAESGVGSALIQRRDATDAHWSTAFVLNGVIATLLAAVLALAAPAIAASVDKAAAAPLLQALAPVLLLNALGVTQMARLQRDLQFRSLALRDTVAQLAGGVVAIWLAFQGAGTWSVVAQSITAAVVGSALLWRASPWRPSLRGASPAALRELLPFCRGIVSFNLLKFLVQNTDRLLLAWLVDATALGIYTYVQKLVTQAVSVLVGGVGGYLFPRLASMQDRPADAARTVLRAQTALLGTLGIGLGFAAVAAPLAIPALLGPAWNAGIALVPLIAATTAFYGLFGPIGESFKAFGRPELLVRWAAMLAAVQGVGTIIGSRFGIIGVAAGVLAATVVSTPYLLSLSARDLPMSMRAAAGLVRSVVGGAAVAAGPSLLTGLLTTSTAGRWASLAIGGAAGALLLARRLFTEPALRSLLEGRIRPATSA